MVLGHNSLRSQARGLITTLRGPCRLDSGHRPKNSEITARQHHCEANKKTKQIPYHDKTEPYGNGAAVGKKVEAHKYTYPRRRRVMVGCRVPSSAIQEYNIIYIYRRFRFEPIAFETSGSCSPSTRKLLREIGPRCPSSPESAARLSGCCSAAPLRWPEATRHPFS